MERDFLGLGKLNPVSFMLEESRGGRFESVGSAAHWLFPDKASTRQKVMAFDNSGEDNPRRLLFDSLSSPHTFEANNKSYAVKGPEKSLSMERQGVTEFSMHPSQNQAIDTHRCMTRHLNDSSFIPISRSSIPIAMNSHFLKSHSFSNGSNPSATAVKQQHFRSVLTRNLSSEKIGVGAFIPRNMPKLQMKTAQLTIFYAGSVNVYDDVPSHMAEAIMLMASQECRKDVNTVHPSSGGPFLPPLCKEMVSDSLISVATETLNNKAGAKNFEPLISITQNESSKNIGTSIGAATASTIMPRAVPQARKASLARFLEKRKERVSNMTPYSCEKKNPGGFIALENGPPSITVSSIDALISSN